MVGFDKDKAGRAKMGIDGFWEGQTWRLLSYLPGYIMKRWPCQPECAQWLPGFSHLDLKNYCVEGIKKENKGIKDAQQNSNL